jgi:hypothetical protein
MSSGTEFQTLLTSLLAGLPADSVLKVLHYAARILTHRRQERKGVPWLPDLAGEPDDNERAVAEAIVRSTEAAIDKPVEQWEKAVASAVAELLYDRATSLTTLTWGPYDRSRARRFLDVCRAEPYGLYESSRAWYSTWRLATPEPYSLTDADITLLKDRVQGRTWAECATKLSVDILEIKRIYGKALRKLIEAATGE